MAVITDPDFLSRNQVIFNTLGRTISIYPIGANVGAERTDLSISVGGDTITTSTGSFVSDGVQVDDIFALKDGTDAGHYRISNVAATVLTVTEIDGTAVSWTSTESNLTGQAFENGAYASEGFGGDGNTDVGGATPPSGGDLADGVTLQAVYSFSKEEWRDDTINVGGDDLIRHEFPFEAITAESFEIGGGASHDDWTWFGNPSDTHPYTRKKLRTAGWAEVNPAGTRINEYAGIITLGSLDSDAQVYYQQVSAVTSPVDFVFLGVVNEAIRTFSDVSADNFDRRNYLKLFVRKKARTYAQSEIADIGVTTIQTIVNRFPLSHTTDPAITARDGRILGSSPWRDTHQVAGASDGAKTTGQMTFTSAGSTFQTSGVVNGDTLRITSGTETGYYTIATVDSETQVTIATDAEFTAWGATESSLTFTVLSYYRVADKTTTPGTVADVTSAGAGNGIVETGTPGVGTLTDTTNGDFLGDTNAGNDLVVAGDVLWITSSTGNNGLYKVLDSNTTGASDPTDTVIYVDTSDQPFPGTLEAAVDYRVLTSGMYLQFKDELVQTVNSGSGATTIEYEAAGSSISGRPEIILTGDSWDAGADTGKIVIVTGSTNNDGRYTIHAQETTARISLIATDVLVNETDATPSSTVTVREGFERKIGSATDPAAGFTFAYRWRVFGNNGTLSDVFQFVQHQLRQTSDIDFGGASSRGDITDLLMAFSTPTGTTFDMYIDNLNLNDINNATFQDHSEVNRNFPFTASGSLVFNSNLTDDTQSKYWLFFTNDDAGDNLARDYGTADAIVVQDADGTPITGNVNGAGNHTGSPGTVDSANNTIIPFSYAYDTNTQRGAGSAGTNAPVTLVALGLTTAQFVVSAGTISRATGITLSAVAALERNYSNP